MNDIKFRLTYLSLYNKK